MPIRVPHTLPAVETLDREENIRVLEQPGKPEMPKAMRLAVLNLMPMKLMTEEDLLRILSATPLTLEVDFVHASTHRSKNTPKSHLDTFYKTFADIKDSYYDGMLITGAPVEKIDFEQVDYWPELCEIFDWTRTNVRSTVYICWAAMAGLYHHYGLPKYVSTEKLSGVYRHRVLDSRDPIFRGFDDEFYVPHSRFSFVRREDVLADSRLTLLSESDRSGVYLVKGMEGREFFITGHSEYNPLTLDFEYRRDLAKGLNPSVPENYYRDDDPDKEPEVHWRAHANLLFCNWLHYYANPASAY